MKKIKCRVNKLELGVWKDATLFLTYHLNGEKEDRICFWYPKHKHSKLREELMLMCAPSEKIDLVLDCKPVQLLPHEINFTHIEYLPNQFGFHTITKFYRA